ncbi:hypothetical protein AB0L44_14025 [Nonomuraea wenchangensis]|uniref:hypothetical protein n=1 Tax=Nonomuraea wenchangensis TaxID=568860 RepID=UPI00343785B1
MIAKVDWESWRSTSDGSPLAGSLCTAAPADLDELGAARLMHRLTSAHLLGAGRASRRG